MSNLTERFESQSYDEKKTKTITLTKEEMDKEWERLNSRAPVSQPRKSIELQPFPNSKEGQDLKKKKKEALMETGTEHPEVESLRHEIKRLKEQNAEVVASSEEATRLLQAQITWQKGETESYISNIDSLEAIIKNLESERYEWKDTLSEVEKQSELIKRYETEIDGWIALSKQEPSKEVNVIQAIESAITGLTGMQAYLTGNVIDFLYRWHEKDSVERLKMARELIDRLIKELGTADAS